MRSNKELNDLDIDISELFKAIFRYWRSILLIAFSISVLTLFFLYFKVPVYNSTALIEVKSDAQEGMAEGDFLGSAFSSFGDEKVDKEIEILKTFNINNLALNKVDFKVQYFVDIGLKKVETYNEVPIQVKNITILDTEIIGKKLKLIPFKNGFHLQFNQGSIELNKDKIHYYGKSIKNDYFEFTIEKKDTVEEPIYFALKGNNRQIFESIHKNLQISQINPTAPLIQIGYKDTIPERADTYVNALVESFIHQSIADKSRQNDRIIDFVNKQLHDIKTKLDKSEEKLEKYRIEYKAIDPTLQAETYIAELSKIEVELSQNTLNEKLIQNLIRFTNENKDLDAIAPSLMELGDEPTLELITKLQEAQIEEEGLKTQYSGKHPGLIAVRKQIEHIKKKIILNIKNLKSSMADRNENLIKLKEAYEKNLKLLPTQQRTLINLKRDYEVSSETYNYLLKKKSENEMIKVTILSDYNIIDDAYNNGEPIGIKNQILFILSLILGLILGIVQAIIRNFMNDKIQTKKDIENLTSLPIYGILPKLKQKMIKLEVLKDTKSPFAESYRSLRTNLQFACTKAKGNVVLVTSTISGEGKSTTVANLSAIFNLADYKSIVINLDMRKPTLHHFFDIDNTVGMSTYLSGKNTIEDIIHPTIYEKLDIITSGPIPPNPSELILSNKLDDLINTLKEVYDYIFIDSAPLGLVTDTMHLMQYADISLIVFRANYAEKSFITDFNALVEEKNLKQIGLVINNMEISSVSHGYGYGYGYGYGEDIKKK